MEGNPTFSSSYRHWSSPPLLLAHGREPANLLPQPLHEWGRPLVLAPPSPRRSLLPSSHLPCSPNRRGPQGRRRHRRAGAWAAPLAARYAERGRIGGEGRAPQHLHSRLRVRLPAVHDHRHHLRLRPDRRPARPEVSRGGNHDRPNPSFPAPNFPSEIKKTSVSSHGPNQCSKLRTNRSTKCPRQPQGLPNFTPNIFFSGEIVSFFMGKMNFPSKCSMVECQIQSCIHAEHLHLNIFFHSEIASFFMGEKEFSLKFFDDEVPNLVIHPCRTAPSQHLW